MALVLELVDHRLKRLVIFLRALLHTHHDIAVHLDKAAITIPGEAFVIGGLCHRQHGLVVQSKIENRVHHSRHGVARAGSDRHQQWHRFGITEGRAHNSFHPANPLLHFCLHRPGVTAVMRVKVSADFGRNREARWDRQTDPCHLGQVRAFATEQGLHLSVPVGLTLAEVINKLRRFGFRSRLSFSTGVKRKIFEP